MPDQDDGGAGMTGETLSNTLSEVLDKVRAGRLTPESLALRLLVYDPAAPSGLPRLVDAGEVDPAAVRQRSERITRRAIENLTASVEELADLGLIKAASVEVRVHDLAPQFKLYILNNEEAFFAFYPIVEHTVRLDGTSAAIYDALGKDTTLFEFAATDDADTTLGPAFLDQARAWFDSVWGSIAREYQP